MLVVRKHYRTNQICAGFEFTNRHHFQTRRDLKCTSSMPRGRNGKKHGRAWQRHSSVTGWTAAMKVLDTLSVQQCHGAAWIWPTPYCTKSQTYYRFMCGFASHGHGCTYCVRVLIEHPLETEDVLLVETEDVLALSAHAGPHHAQGDHIVDYCIPMITTVPASERAKYHADHTCHIELCCHQHVSHHQHQTTGAHLVFTAAVHHHPEMMLWDSTQIKAWLRSNNIPDPGDCNMTHRCQRHVQRKRRQEPSQMLGKLISSSTIGGLLAMATALDLTAVQQRSDFGPHTPYLMPGWRTYLEPPPDGHEHASASQPQHGASPHLCLLFTTLNLALNWYRAHAWSQKTHRGGVCVAVDHTFKVCSPALPCSPHSAPVSGCWVCATVCVCDHTRLAALTPRRLCLIVWTLPVSHTHTSPTPIPPGPPPCRRLCRWTRTAIRISP